MTRFITVLLSLWMALAGRVYAQDSVAAARELYASAAYGDALTMLDRMGAHAAPDPGVQLYKALCLFALGKTPDADRTLEEMTNAVPMYRPLDRDIPPRVHARLADVRRRVLPVIVQQRYSQ